MDKRKFRNTPLQQRDLIAAGSSVRKGGGSKNLVDLVPLWKDLLIYPIQVQVVLNQVHLVHVRILC